MAKLSHTDASGKANMVDVTQKAPTSRTATASAQVCLSKTVFELVDSNQNNKGDVLAVANIAGVAAAKKTSELIPLCHSLDLTNIRLDFVLDPKRYTVEITAIAKTTSRTGVEMEALTAVSIAALTVYDMCKSADKNITISDIRLLEKRGGRSGTFKRSRAK